MGTWENLGDLGNGIFSKKNLKKPGNWESGLGIDWEMSISKNMEVYGVKNIHFLKKSSEAGFLNYIFKECDISENLGIGL